MNRRMWCFVVVTLQIMSWESVTSWPFAPSKAPHDEGYILGPPQVEFKTKQGFKSMGRLCRKEEEYEELSKLGSRPPNCVHKCGGCNPCDAIQVPEITDHLGVQYANYEPEGWKCKCGTSFFNP